MFQVPGFRLFATVSLVALVFACGSSTPAEPDAGPVDWGNWTEGECVIPEGETPDHSAALGCLADFEALASRPMDASIPGARSSKTVVDTIQGGVLYFTNSEKYPMHWFFAKDHLSVLNGLPPVPQDRATFSKTEYYSPYRRFLLGAVTFYEEPGVWVYEIAPYDTSLPEMVVTAYDLISEAAFFGDVLYFHPTSEIVERLLPDLPDHVKVITTDELFAGVTFLPLNLGETIGYLKFVDVARLESGDDFVTPQQIVVLDSIPNDISVVAGVITDALQTPLSHINVLSQNRGTPNMALIGAMSDKELRALEGKWVRLTVGPFAYSVEEVSAKEADEWWEEHKPPTVELPELDLSVKELRDAEDLTVDDIPAFGGKASHYGMLTQLGEEVPVPKAFAIPVYFYKQFEEQNGFDVFIDALLADDDFKEDMLFREAALSSLREVIVRGTLDPDFLYMVELNLALKYPGVRMRFRSSTNAEDLGGFTGAGLYTSKSGQPGDPKRPVEDAIREVYASLWNFRAFEERQFRSIDHKGVAMALLVHRSFPDEDVNGVALTNNIFDPMQSAFYVNVQKGEISVVKPPAGITTDQFLYFYSYPNQPATFLGHSNLVGEGETVLTDAQTYRLGTALSVVHQSFAKYYFNPQGFYAMDVEFKFNTDPGDAESKLWVKQARPHSGWAQGLQTEGGEE